ncbi:hypothetical protein LTR04_004706, partial [Oleoguttula sp. CCFEE 6159]
KQHPMAPGHNLQAHGRDPRRWLQPSWSQRQEKSSYSASTQSYMARSSTTLKRHPRC